ncbi:MAG: alpha/beta hydrolase [Candidatus Melainabacteria bacterium]|nr:alpha/beta hydrolase [Candidatus Melainabacteria bacterium]
MESEEPFDKQFLQTKFGALHMVSRTCQSPQSNIVLLHGLVVNSSFMTPTAQYLSHAHNVFVPDLIGNGKSDNPQRPLTVSENADSVVEVIQNLNIQNPVLVGGSYGAQIAVELANRDINARALVFVGPLPKQTSWQCFKGLSLDAPHEPLPLTFNVLNEIFIRMGIPRAHAMLRDIGEYPFHERLDNVNIPALVVSGEHDPFYSAAFMEKIVRVAHSTQRVCLPKSGHGLPYSRPEVISAFINSFLEATQKEDDDRKKGVEINQNVKTNQRVEIETAPSPRLEEPTKIDADGNTVAA